jgi:hypothetical protein
LFENKAFCKKYFVPPCHRLKMAKEERSENLGQSYVSRMIFISRQSIVLRFHKQPSRIMFSMKNGIYYVG